MADQVELHVVAYLTRNNSERDEQDDALWADLRREVAELVAAKCPDCHGPRFELIRAEVY
jgi:mono/diheme cytochrome c family protein